MVAEKVVAGQWVKLKELKGQNAPAGHITGVPVEQEYEAGQSRQDVTEDAPGVGV